MTEGNIRALKDLRDVIVEQRREAAGRGDIETVIATQQQVVILDAAIADERALGQTQKDEEAMGRALRRPDDQSSIGDVSIVSDAIKIAD
jgi:hypothetical protein